MTDTEYLDRAEQLLGAVERACDDINESTDADIDNQRVGGMITLTFLDGSQMVINLQPPLHEVWLASKAGGYHYQFRDGGWRDTKTASEFFADLSRMSSAQSQRTLRFGPRG